MANEVGPVTEGSSSEIKEVFPYLRVRNAAAAIEFYTRVFGARELFRLTEPGGRIGHAELSLGGITLMLADEYPEYGISVRNPSAVRGCPFTCMSPTPTSWRSGP
jgi:PhnB protein